MLQALPRGQFSGLVLLVYLRLASAKAKTKLKPAQLVNKRLKAGFPSDCSGSAKPHLFFILHQGPELADVLLEALGDLAEGTNLDGLQ